MRENRKFVEYDTAFNELRYLTPRIIKEGRSPSAMICDGKIAFFNEHVTLGKEVLAWCMPAKSGENRGENRENFHALPIEDLDAIHSIYLLNEYFATDENHPDYEMRKAAIATVLQGLVTLRPHRILCAEGEVASESTLTKLESREFSLGQPEIIVGEISYLGTFPGRTENSFMAVGTNGSTYVNGITGNYIGPIYIQNLTRTTEYGGLYQGKPVHLLPEKKKQMLAQRYENRDDMSKTDPALKSAVRVFEHAQKSTISDMSKLDQLILEMLNSQP